MTMRRTLPILAIVLFAAAACNRGAAPRAAVSGPETIANQSAPAAGQQPGPIDESSTALASPPASTPNQPPRSVVLAAPGAAGIDRASTILDSRLLSDPQVRDVSEKVRVVADRLDKMYCYCHCHEEMGHRSLLTCFQGTHAAECTICLREGYQAWVDFQAGRPVEQTQQVVDAMYHQGAPPPSLPSGE